MVDGRPEIDVIYRVVGVGTRWMESLRAGDFVSVLGPQGNQFPICETISDAWLVAGGVGLPPMLFFAESLQRACKSVTAFCGAQTADLLALTIDPQLGPSKDATEATLCAKEFGAFGAATIVSTDDGSLGYAGHVGQALEAFSQKHPPSSDGVVVYTCGPERMMEYVSHFCADRNLRCFVCMERAMACGTGMCQSCVVPVQDQQSDHGWRYRLCCTEGPVFSAADILWEQPSDSSS